ncbi:hypothetical protein KY363_03160 [Candidatus Woesearchaeota archaeon]|nr:hypothetical protein [Candidatus Woesearchaeota archaeon]
MKSLVFDAGPVISLTTNNLLWILDQLKQEFNGMFYVPSAVKGELVDKPLQSKRFKFEALQVMFRINNRTLDVIDDAKIKMLAEELLELANHTFKTRGNWLRIVHYAEMEVLATAIIMNSSAVVIDERTTRLLVESPKDLTNMLSSNLRSKVFINKPSLDKLRNWTKNIRIIRSVELVLMAYEQGILDKYLLEGDDARRTLVDSLLWGVKLHGCAVTRNEIRQLVELEAK